MDDGDKEVRLSGLMRAVNPMRQQEQSKKSEYARALLGEMMRWAKTTKPTDKMRRLANKEAAKQTRKERDPFKGLTYTKARKLMRKMAAATMEKWAEHLKREKADRLAVCRGRKVQRDLQIKLRRKAKAGLIPTVSIEKAREMLPELHGTKPEIA